MVVASHRFDALAGFNDGVTALLAAAAVTTARPGTAVHDAGNDAFSATLRCHDANGELYMVNFSHDRVTLASYSDEAIRTAVKHRQTRPGTRIISPDETTRREETPVPSLLWSSRRLRRTVMETEMVGILLGVVLPLYPLLFAIYRKNRQI